MEDYDWITVYTVADPIKAEIIKNALTAEGVRCTLEGANQAAEPGLIALAVKVQVLPESADFARKFIDSHERRALKEVER